jgi:hypothetical protein
LGNFFDKKNRLFLHSILKKIVYLNNNPNASRLATKQKNPMPMGRRKTTSKEVVFYFYAELGISQ